MNESDRVTIDKFKQINFLILEDESDIGEITEETLKDFGFVGQFHQANSIKSAKEILLNGQSKIDFIISDWNLDEMSGLDLLIQVRALTEFESTPFLMVTANDNVSGLLVATKKGANDYLVKPWSPEEFLEKIINCLTGL